jgi:uncharacterized membrane protein YbjE (DUF340 family)
MYNILMDNLSEFLPLTADATEGKDRMKMLDIISYVLVFLLAIIIGYVLWRLKMKIDRSGLITLMIYLFTASVTALSNILTNGA